MFKLLFCHYLVRITTFATHMNSFFQNKRFTLFWSISFLLATLLCSPFNEATAQRPVAPPSSDTTQIDTTSDNIIHIRYADELNYLATGEDTIQKLIGHVEMNQDTLFLFCDSSTILNSVDMVAQGNFIMQQGDSMTCLLYTSPSPRD